jgi:hypothetical protein
LKNFQDRFLVKLIILLLLFFIGVMSARCAAARPSVKAKFYDFSEHLIDGQVRKPQALYTDVRQAAEFKRLLKLKKSFMKELFDTARLPVFK